MTKYRTDLPQLSDEIFLTDGGIETTLIFHENLELPDFAAFHLLKNEDGVQALKKYFRTYAALAKLYPVAKTIAAINLDAGNPFGMTKDVASAGFGNSTIDYALATAAEMQGRTFLKESLDGNGAYYFASDQIEFAKAGIPAVFPWSGFDYVGKTAEYGEKKWNEYGKTRYHQVSDEVMPDWDMTGTAEDARWMMIAGYLIANDLRRPSWLPGTEFKK